MGALYVIPISLVLLIVSMIVRLAIISITPDVSILMNGAEQNFDFFSYYKSNVFLFLVIFAAVFLIYYKWRNAIKYDRTITYIPILVYAVTIIISTYLSQYRGVSLHGTIDRYE